MPNYCYIIYSGERTYNGYTVNLGRRIRQHNGELVGGARSTKCRQNWQYLVIITHPSWTKNEAMSLEWHIRYPTNKKPRPKCYSGVDGRLVSLSLLDLTPEHKVYVHNDYVNRVTIPCTSFTSIDEIC